MLTKRQLIDIEKTLAAKYDDGQYPYLTHLSGGNEDELIKLFTESFTKGDYVFSTHRSHYHYLLAGGSVKRLERFVDAGKSMFIFDRKLNFYSSSILAGTPGIAAGVAWALKKKGSDRHVWCFIGDGASDEGHLYEACRYVDGFELPCTFVIEDNNRSVTSTRIERWNIKHWASEYARQFHCVLHYDYTPIYPHAGSGSGGWLKFKREAVVLDAPKKWKFTLDPPSIAPRKYKQAVTEAMAILAAKGYIFVGYNVRHGSAYSTLENIPNEQKLETPVAENLMAGLAMGMSLEGFKSVLFFERHDFIWNAMDALVNQLDMIERISDGEFKFHVIIKAVVGSVKPFYAGPTHTSNITGILDSIFSFPVLEPRTSMDVIDMYMAATQFDGPCMISELKELYEEVC